MLGNVWEWTYDKWRDKYSSAAVLDPVFLSSGSDRVLRGGGWFNDARNVRSAIRVGDSPSSRNYYLGFRLVRVDNKSPES